MIKKTGTAKAVKHPNIYLKISYPSNFSGKKKTVCIKTTPIIKGNLRKLIVCDSDLFILISFTNCDFCYSWSIYQQNLIYT